MALRPLDVSLRVALRPLDVSLRVALAACAWTLLGAAALSPSAYGGGGGGGGGPGAGDCVPIDRCPRLSALHKESRLSPQEVAELSNARCGGDDSTPKVFCSPVHVTTDTRIPATTLLPTTTLAPATTPAPSPASTPTAAPLPSAAPAHDLVDDTSCATPDGQIGRCVSIDSCPHLMQLSTSKSVENELFVRNSRCENADPSSVCCGKSPPPSETHFLKQKDCKLGAAPPDPRIGCCGRHPEGGDRITGGNDTGIDQYPWLALIEYKSSHLKLLCGGALISGRYVLTAAHCIVGQVENFGTPANVRLGEYNTDNEVTEMDCVPTSGGGVDCADPAVVVPIERIVVHQLYRTYRHEHDIALIRMKHAAPYTNFIRPICLPSMDVTQNLAEDIMLYAAGWGALDDFILRSKIKQHILLPYVNLTDCQAIYSQKNKNTRVWSKQLCAGGEEGKDVCRKDSGGPLMYKNGLIYEVLGIVSFGPAQCGLKNVPSVFTKVYEYNAWIRSHIRP